MGCTYQGVKWMHLGRPISQLLVDVLFWNEEMEMLSQVFDQQGINIRHLDVAKDRLKDKRMLVVLDDVDHEMQLDALAK